MLMTTSFISSKHYIASQTGVKISESIHKEKLTLKKRDFLIVKNDE